MVAEANAERVELTPAQRVAAWESDAVARIGLISSLARGSGGRDTPALVRARIVETLHVSAERIVAEDAAAGRLLITTLHARACAPGEGEPMQTLRLVYRGLRPDEDDPCLAARRN
jgi:hypothetical protein